MLPVFFGKCTTLVNSRYVVEEIGSLERWGFLLWHHGVYQAEKIGHFAGCALTAANSPDNAPAL